MSNNNMAVNQKHLRIWQCNIAIAMRDDSVRLSYEVAR